MAEIGSTGLASFSGQIQEDFLRELRGREAYKRYNEMRLNSPIISAMLMAYEQAIRKISWEFTSDEENDPRIELLEQARDNLTYSWNDHITEALTMLPFGYSIFEIVYERVDSKLLWRKFAPRGQDTVYQWGIDEEGGLTGFTQMAAPSYKTVFIPIEKMILYRTRVEKNNPEGRSILRSAWIPYYYAKHIGQIEAITIERDGAGLPVIKLPQGASTGTGSETDQAKAEKVVRNIRNDEQAGVTLPFGWEIELLASAGSKQIDTDKVIRRYESRMLMSALAQFLQLGQDGSGSLALSRDQTDFFNMSVNSLADIIADTFTKFAIPRLLKLNGYDPAGVRLEHTPVGDVDSMMLADVLQKVGGMVTWDAEDEVWLRSLLSMPERDPEQLRAEKEEGEAERKAIAQGIKAKAEQPAEDVPTDEEMPDDMSVDYFAANPPDDAKRLRFERDFRKQVAASLTKQKNRILKAAKSLKWT